MESSSNILRRNSEDVGWDYGMLVDPLNLDKVKCKLCEKVLNGGIYRLKQHIAHVRGNTAPCKNSSDEDKRKCKKAIDDVKNRKRQKNQHEEEVRREVILEDDEEVEGSLGPPKKEPRALGTMDKFVSSIDPDFSLNDTKKLRQQYIHESLWKERKHQVDQFLARWVYEAGIPFNAIDNDSFKRLMEAVGQFGPGYKPATQYQLREPLLKEEVERTKSLLKKQEEEWALNGCSIMTDAWTDRKRRSIMNLCVNCKEGTTFLSSKETSDEAHTGSYIFEYVDKCIEEVGPEKVVQVVTDNASNNMAAGNLLKLKRPNYIFWTSCATHTLKCLIYKMNNQMRDLKCKVRQF